MSQKNSSRSFEQQFSTEIFFEIFDYLASDEIISIFFHLNQRFNSIVWQYLQLLTRFRTPINNYSLWQTILPTIRAQIKYLTITTLDFPCSLDLFPNLESLFISSSLPIADDQLSLILKNEQFKKLRSFKIKSEIVSRNETVITPVLTQLLQIENSLQTFQSLSEIYQYFPNVNNSTFGINLRSLSLKLSLIYVVFSLLEYTPNLKHLTLASSILPLQNQSILNRDLSHIKLEKLSLIIQKPELYEKNFLYLRWFIKQFSASLCYLSLNIDQVYNYDLIFNGFALQQQVLESMIQLKSLHLYAQLDIKPTDVETLLATFQTPFWFDHHWTVAAHGTYLYTLPFHFDELKNFIDFDGIQSSNPKIFDSPNLWSHVKSINPSTSTKLNVNILKQMKARMPNLTSIRFGSRFADHLYKDDDETKQTNITLDTITTVSCHNDGFQTIKQWLPKIFPNTRDLTFVYFSHWTASSSNSKISSQELDENCHKTDDIYLYKVRYAEIKVAFTNFDHLYENVTCFVKEFLKTCPNLQSFIMHFHHIREFLRTDSLTDLNQMIAALNMEKLSKKFHIKHIYNYLQFVRNDNE